MVPNPTKTSKKDSFRRLGSMEAAARRSPSQVSHAPPVVERYVQNSRKNPSNAMGAPIIVSTANFQAASSAFEVLSKPTSRTLKSVMSSTATQTRFGSASDGTASNAKASKL